MGFVGLQVVKNEIFERFVGFLGLQVVKKMKQTIRKYLFEGLWGSVGFVVVCGFYSHPDRTRR